MPWQPSKLCVSLLPESIDHLHNLLRQCGKADMIELRLDHVGQIPFHKVRDDVAKPLIITVRPVTEGGYWKGSDDTRLKIFQRAVDAKMDYLDIEYISANEILSRLQISRPTSLIISCHTQENRSEKLRQLFRTMQQVKGDVYKFIYQSAHLSDNVVALELLEECAAARIKAVIHAMGESGQISRLMGAVRGNLWSYVSLDGAEATAEGQVSLDDAHDIYGLNARSENTRIIGLVGYPLAQSQGWKLHNRLIQWVKQKPETGKKIQDFIYLNFPTEDFKNFWKNWEDQLDGLSITIPYKQSILEMLDYISHTVEISGVCNTAVKRDGRWWGFNTDMLAIYDLLCKSKSEFPGGAVVYGTGATARSAIAALKVLNIKPIYICGRTPKKGRQIAQEFTINFIPEQDLSSIHPELIIQTTPVGMIPHPQKIPPLSPLLSNARLVLDVIHNPPHTRLLQEASAEGCSILSGHQMYLHQATYQFGLFSGFSISYNEMESFWKQVISG